MSEILNRCASFEWRGPFLSLARVENDTLEVIKSSTDWSDVVGEKTIFDNRNANLADLYPKPRVMFENILNRMDEQNANTKMPKMKGLGY